MPAKFSEQEVSSGLKNRRRLSQFLETLIREHMPHVGNANLQYIFCNDAFLLGINQQFLDHDTLTDIITFDLSESNDLLGEIYISTERVRENAAIFKVPYQHELHRVIFHGALHLCGLRDKTPDEIAAMRAAEETCLQQYFQTQ